MNFREYKKYVASDFYRLGGDKSLRRLLRALLSGGSFVYIFWMRTCAFTHSGRVRRLFLYPIARIALRRNKYRLGVSIPWRTEIGGGLYISHFTGVIVNQEAVIGRNCNLSQGVTIGQTNRGPRKGTPTIGNGVYIGPGAKVIGAVTIGSGAAIGANSVVTKDVPAGVTVAGVPARVISDHGSEGYIGNEA